MYRMYADGKLLYAPYLSNEGYGVISPKLTVELNKAGSLEYTLAPNNVLYNDITKLGTIITVHQEDDEIFRGRVLHDEKDFYKQKKVYCEGELAFLLDSKQRPYTFSGTIAKFFGQCISNHNKRVEASKQFAVGEVTLEGNISASNYDYPTTFDEIADKIINVYGGYLKVRKVGDTHYIDLLKESGDVNTQMIEFGVNLLDLSEYITAEDIYTVLIPLGAELEDESGDENAPKRKLTIIEENEGKDYLDDTAAIAIYGRIEKVQEWPEIDGDYDLLKAGQDALKRNIELAMTLSVKAVDMHLLNVDAETIRLGDWVRVLSLPHGLDKLFQCTKIVYDLVSPDQTEYVFGVGFNSLTEQQLNEKKNMKSSMSTVTSAASAMSASIKKANEAANKVEEVIAVLPTEYVKTETFDAYKLEVEQMINGAMEGSY